MQEFVEGDGFDDALGVEFGEEGVLQGGEFLVFIGADDEVPGGESMAEGVLGDAGLAFGGARSG